MSKYRNESTGEVVEAVQFAGNPLTIFDRMEAFVGGDAEFRDGKLLIATRHGPLWASPDDWLVKGSDGKFRACEPGIFAKTHKPLKGE